MSVERCQVEFSETGRSLVQRIPTECGVSDFDLKIKTLTRPSPTRAVESLKSNNSCESMRTRNTHFVIHICMFSVDFLLNNFCTNDAKLLHTILQNVTDMYVQ